MRRRRKTDNVLLLFLLFSSSVIIGFVGTAYWINTSNDMELKKLIDLPRTVATVKPQDTYSSIMRREMGENNWQQYPPNIKYRAFEELNPDLSPENLRTGQKVIVPSEKTK